MRNLKRMGAALMSLALMLSMNLTSLAAVEDTGYADVDAGSWYAQAVEYVRDNGLMSGTSDTTFTPDGAMTRGMLVTTLYRAAGSPSLENENLGYPFADVPGDAWYADGIYWARLTGVVSGYSDEEFGPNDPVSREQLAAILWRYAGSPAAEGGEDFADEGDISAYALQAVDWARSAGIVSGDDSGRFAPQSGATRAEAAAILRAFLTREAPETPDTPTEETDVLVVYFSATGNTQRVASQIAVATSGDLFELTPADPYTHADLNCTDEASRVV